MWVINPASACHYFPPGLQLPSQPLRGMLQILLLVEQRHDGCEQFAWDCYSTASRLRFEPGPFCAWVQHANHSATQPPIVTSEKWQPAAEVVGDQIHQHVCQVKKWIPFNGTISSLEKDVLTSKIHVLHRESKKTTHLTLAHKFTKYWPIFKILSLLDSVGNL